MSRRIIFTADDYGMCGEVNAAIEDCLQANTIRSTCVMTNMPDYGAAASLKRRFPGASIGLHWTTGQGAPVLAAETVPSLTDADGRFWAPSEFRRRWRRRLIKRDELRAELVAQFNRYVSVAGRPAFWSTHQNTHVGLGLFSFFVQVGLDLGISAMRCHRRILISSGGSRAAYLAAHPLFLLKGVVISYYSARAERMGMRMPLQLIYSPDFGREFDIIAVAASHRVPTSVRAMEMVFHPATSVVPELFGKMTDRRIQEWRLLRDPQLCGRLASAGVHCAAFEIQELQ